MSPRIPVIVTAHNMRQYLPEALRSLGNQTLDRSKFEVIGVKNFEDPKSSLVGRLRAANNSELMLTLADEPSLNSDIYVILLEANVIGGIQLMTMDLINALATHNLNVTLVSSEVSPRVLNYIGKEVRGRVSVLKLPRVSTVTFQMTLSRLFYRRFPGLLSINMHGDVQPIDADIIYFHQFHVDYDMLSQPRARLRLAPQYSIRSNFIQLIKGLGRLVLVNSNWTKAEARRFWGLEARVLYPPVHVERFMDINNEDRPDRVLTLSRFSRDRGLEGVLRLAKELPKYEFVIAGYVQDPAYFRYLYDNKPNNVRLLPNISEEDKRWLLSSSKVYLNPTPYIEGFGIAIVEAMSAGLIPVTRSRGGPVDYVPSEFLFSGENDMREKVVLAMKAWDKDSMCHMKEIAKRFSFERFSRELISLVHELLSSSK